jgi:poly(3-hydroxybutyrate) depolymerase
MRKPLIMIAMLAASAGYAGTPPVVDIDPGKITVSGISAGGQMAHQVHIAYSDLFNGAAIIAAGPYGCAEGSLSTAMSRCMGAADAVFESTEQAAAIRIAAEAGELADPANLENDPVWLFHGTLDTTMGAGLSDALAALYAEFIPADQILYVSEIEAGHGFPAQGHGSGCTAMQPPFVIDCNYDAAGQLLQHLYPDLVAPAQGPEFELTELSLPGATEAGLSETAYLYIPPDCASGEQTCALHLVLHGCAQSAVQVGTDFIQQSGFLPWAQANDIVMAFPQVVPGALNPYACWDWWGYTGENYDTRDGAQMTVLANWIGGFTNQSITGGTTEP